MPFNGIIVYADCEAILSKNQRLRKKPRCAVPYIFEKAVIISRVRLTKRSRCRKMKP